jgi:hypothetical protein
MSSIIIFLVMFIGVQCLSNYFMAGGMAQVVEHLPRVHKNLHH